MIRVSILTSVRQSLFVLSVAVLLACQQPVAAQTSRINAGRGLMCMAYTPDGRFLATAGRWNTVKIWDIASREISVRITLPIKPNHAANVGNVVGLAYSSDGTALAALTVVACGPRMRSKTKKLFLCDPAEGNVKQTIDVGIQANELIEFKNSRFSPRNGGAVNMAGAVGFPFVCGSVAFSYKDEYVIAAADHARMWDREGKLVKSYKGATGSTYCFAASASHHLLATADTKGTIQVLDYAGKSLYRQQSKKRRPLAAIAFSGDGRYVAFANDKHVGLIDVQSRRRIRDLRPRRSFRPITSVAFSPNSTLIASANFYGTVTLWDIKRRRILVSIPGYGHAVKALAFSPDGKTLAYFSSNGVVRLHSLEAVHNPGFPPNQAVKDREKHAAGLLRLAKILVGKKPDVARRRLEKIVKEYAETEAAATAEELLDKLM